CSHSWEPCEERERIRNESRCYRKSERSRMDRAYTSHAARPAKNNSLRRGRRGSVFIGFAPSSPTPATGMGFHRLLPHPGPAECPVPLHDPECPRPPCSRLAKYHSDWVCRRLCGEEPRETELLQKAPTREIWRPPAHIGSKP